MPIWLSHQNSPDLTVHRVFVLIFASMIIAYVPWLSLFLVNLLY